jgi:regulatory factor X
MIHQMLQFPPVDGSLGDNESFQLPDIHGYVPANSDSKVAEALAALYRSHCISVIDSFRYCKEKNLLRYFSTFHGTLTVPVQKLLTHPNVAPWVKECDWLMYQKMIAFVAPLTTQVVPQLVLDAFNSISQRLTAHIADTFKAQPVHMSLARLVPAHTFSNLLRHMLDVNQAANAAAAWLCHPDNRQQMWNDFKTLVDPSEMMIRANIPGCVERTTRQILKNDVRALLTPIGDTSTSTAQPFFSKPDMEEDIQAHHYPVQPAIGEDYNFPDKWVSFILNLPAIFPHHRTQCIMERVDALWDCILHRLTLGGAQSFSAWWMTKVFFHEMMAWQAEKGGFMRHTPRSLQNAATASEQAGLNKYLARQPSCSDCDRNQSFVTSDTQQNSGSKSRPTTSPSAAEGASEDRHLETESQHNNPANEKQSEHMTNFHAPNNDDSAIDLDDDSMLISVGKYGDMMASDPADAEGEVVVI